MQAVKTANSDLYLPGELIAQTLLERRDTPRLSVLDKKTGATWHMHFFDLLTFLHPGDCLVLNGSRVLPVWLLGHRESTGDTVEVLPFIDRGDKVWERLAHSGRKLKPGTRLFSGDGSLKAEVVEVCEGGNRLVRFEYGGIFLEVLERLNKMPLLPYIKVEPSGPEQYQTVYSREADSVAAPTVGLHFTCALLEQVQEMGVKACYMTFRAGLSTFRPTKEEEVIDHEIHNECCMISAETIETINRARQEGERVIRVDTTSCRTIESWTAEDGMLRECAGWTNIFTYPGHHFKALDCPVINFHLPESTLVMLVPTPAGREHVLAAYKETVEQRYRFFSSEDAIFTG